MSTTIEDREALALLTRRAGVSALAVTAALLLSSALVGQVLALSTWFVPKVIGLFALVLVGSSGAYRLICLAIGSVQPTK